MSLETHNFEFREFVLDTREQVLFRSGEPVPLTPKAYLLLRTLLQHCGHIVERERLMDVLWEGSFVEDGNLTFTVNRLRKVLGDDPLKPHFVETVPRRGYRFIADVKRVRPETERPRETPETINGRSIDRSRARRFYMALAVVLIPTVMVSGLWYAKNSGAASNVPILSAPFGLEKISADGNGLHAAISQDGQNVVYTNGVEGKQSIWLRQLTSANNLQILEPADYFYYGLALSPDGNVLYFNRRPKLIERQGDIYRVSIFGGVPVKIVSEAQGHIGVSPDGRRISYVRCPYRADENCSLWIADSDDGKNERKLLSRPRPIRIGDHEFSPDGRSITFAVGQSENQGSEFGLAEVNIENGSEREITRQKFFNIKSIAWLPDESGLLVTASRMPDKTFHIWRISADGGEPERLTNDGATYSGLSLDRDGRTLISTQIRQNFHLRVYSTKDPTDVRVLADATSVSYARNGNIVFSSARTGDHEIWSINPDGSGQQQLTNNVAEDRTSAVSPDGNFIFFGSNRSGDAQVWRMDSDGSDQIRLTANEGGFPVSVSADGKWLYYTSALRRTLRRVSTGGGSEEVVLDRRSSSFAISPDGSQACITEQKGDAVHLLVISLVDKSTIRSFTLPPETNSWVDLAWTSDGKSIAYITRNSEMQNNTVWLQPLDGSAARQIADLGNEQVSELSGFALSPDGTSFAVSIGRWEHDAVLLRGLNRFGSGDR